MTNQTSINSIVQSLVSSNVTEAVPGFAEMLLELENASRTRTERDGSKRFLTRSLDRIDQLLERWYQVYLDQCRAGQPRLALINALLLCAEEGVPLPDWVAWDIRDASNLLLINAIPLDDSLHVKPFKKFAHAQAQLLRQQLAMRVRFEVDDLINSGKRRHKTEALKKLANTVEFPFSASTLGRMLELSKQGTELSDRVLKGKTNHRK